MNITDKIFESEVVMMGRRLERLNIKEVTYKYSGTDNELTLFLKTIIYDHLVKNKIITDKPLKEVNLIVGK